MSNTLANLFVLVFQASLITSVLAVAVWLICRKTQSFITPTLAITLWTLVLLRLFIVTGPASNLSLSNWLPQTASGWQQTTFSIRTNLSNDCTLTNSDNTQVNKIEGPTTTLTWPVTNWILCISIVWTVVAFILLARLHCKAIRGLAVLATNNFPADKSLQAIYDDCQTSLKITRSPRLIISNHVSVPAIVGLFRPLIVVPEWCQRELSRDQLRLILTHELVHYQRCDLWRQWLYCLASAIHWFNPIVNRIIHRLLELHEVACDRRVVAVAASAWSLPTRMYGETILQLAARADDRCVAKGVCGTSSLAIGFVRDGCSLKERILMLTKKQNGYRFGKALVGTLLVGALVLVGYTRAQESEKANALPVSKIPEPAVARFVAWEPGQPPYIALAMQLFRGETKEMEQFALDIGIEPGDITTESVVQAALAPYKTKQSVGKMPNLCNPTMIARNNQKCELVMGGEIAVPVATEKSVAGEEPSEIRTELFGLKVECQPTVSADSKDVFLLLTTTEQSVKAFYKSVMTMQDLTQRDVDVPNLRMIGRSTVVKAKVGEPVAIRLDTIGPIELTNLHGEQVDVTTIVVVTPVLVAEAQTEDKK